MKEIIASNSFQHASKVYEETQAFLAINTPLVSDLNEHRRAFKVLLDLIPQEVQKLFSGHLFPFLEADFEVENAFLVSALGFYRLAFISLRSVLELSLLSVYFDRKGESEKVIQGWLKSKENTPFFSEIRKALFSLERFAKVQTRYDLKLELESLYYNLCDYNHTKGNKFSNRGLGNGFSNCNVFSEKTFMKFLGQFKAVIRMSIALHLVRYPVGLLHTPLFQKCGYNRILGTFIEPEEGELFKSILQSPLIEILQGLANSDAEAISQAKYINDLPDLTEKDIEAQLLKMHKADIEREGWNHWIKNVGALFLDEHKDDSGDVKQRKSVLKAELHQWAIDNQHIESKIELFLKKGKPLK